MEIYRRAYTEKINLDDEIKANENRLDQLKERFMREIETLENEIENLNANIESENQDMNLERENLYSKYEESKKNI